MLATSHVIIGGAVGIATKNPALGFAVGVTSHFICDAIPHLDAPFKIELVNGEYDKPLWNKKLIVFALCDSLLAFFLTLFLGINFLAYLWLHHLPGAHLALTYRILSIILLCGATKFGLYRFSNSFTNFIWVRTISGGSNFSCPSTGSWGQ